MAPETHAAYAHEMQMPVSGSMASHCDNAVKSDAGHADSACAHCDQPDELIQSKASLFNIDFEQPLILVTPTIIDSPAKATVDFSVRAPTGPPRSSSLIYTTTKRIRI